MESGDKKKKYQVQRGFTLIEMMIAMFVFSLIVGSISGLFITGIRGQRSTLARQRLLDQTSYTLEYMSRALRMAMKQTSDLAPCLLENGNGFNYEIPSEYQIGGNPKLGTGLKFINNLEKDLDDQCQIFFLDSVSGQLMQTKGGVTLPLTSDKLKITSLKFFLSGESQTDNLQPRVTVFLEIKGKGQKIEEQPLMKIQTTISQRNLDIEY